MFGLFKKKFFDHTEFSFSKDQLKYLLSIQIIHGPQQSAAISELNDIVRKKNTHNRIKLIKRMVKIGVDLNVIVNFGTLNPYSALETAVQYNDAEVVELYLKHGAKPIQRVRPFQENLFNLAISNNNEEIAILLVNYGADINFRNPISAPPLFQAIEMNFIELGKILIKAGADVNASAMYKEKLEFILDLAIACDCTELVKLLIEKKATSIAMNNYKIEQLEKEQKEYIKKSDLPIHKFMRMAEEIKSK